MDSKPELEEPQPKRFKGGEPISERSPPEAKVRPNTLGLGVKTTDMSPPGMFISATPSLGLSTDTPSKLIVQCDPLVTKLLQGSTGESSLY